MNMDKNMRRTLVEDAKIKYSQRSNNLFVELKGVSILVWFF